MVPVKLIGGEITADLVFTGGLRGEVEMEEKGYSVKGTWRKREILWSEMEEKGNPEAHRINRRGKEDTTTRTLRTCPAGFCVVSKPYYAGNVVPSILMSNSSCVLCPL